VWGRHRATRGALLAQEPVALGTVVTTGAPALKVQMLAAAPPWRRGHDSRRLLSRPVTTRHSRATCPVRCLHGFGQGGICCHSWSIRLPGVERRDGSLAKRADRHRSHTGLPSLSGLDAATPSVTTVPDSSQRATPRNPCRMRGNPIYRSGPGYHRLLHGRTPASLVIRRRPIPSPSEPSKDEMSERMFDGGLQRLDVRTAPSERHDRRARSPTTAPAPSRRGARAALGTGLGRTPPGAAGGPRSRSRRRDRPQRRGAT